MAERRRPDLLPVLVLLVLGAILAGGYLLFPYVLARVQTGDCIAAGRTDCAGPGRN